MLGEKVLGRRMVQGGVGGVMVRKGDGERRPGNRFTGGGAAGGRTAIDLAEGNVLGEKK